MTFKPCYKILSLKKVHYKASAQNFRCFILVAMRKKNGDPAIVLMADWHIQVNEDPLKVDMIKWVEMFHSMYFSNISDLAWNVNLLKTPPSSSTRTSSSTDGATVAPSISSQENSPPTRGEGVERGEASGRGNKKTSRNASPSVEFKSQQGNDR